MLHYTAGVWSGTTLQSPSGVGTIPLSPSGVGNSKIGVGPVFGEWMEWGSGYEVETVVWEWGIRSGGVGVEF